MKQMIMVMVVAGAALTAPVSNAMDAGQEIRMQGQAAMAAIQAEFRANLAPTSASRNENEPIDTIGAAIRAQAREAMRAIAWENEATLHATTLVAGTRGTPANRGYVAVSAPLFEPVAETN
jgi:hypothetical protein